MTIASQPEKKTWQNTLSLALSALGILVFTTLALLLVFFGTSMSGFLAAPEAQLITGGMLVWASILFALALMPVFVLSLRAYRGKNAPTWLDLQGQPTVGKVILWSILLWPLAILAGWQVAGSPALARFLLGPINLLVAGLPVLWIFNLAQWKLKGGSPLRKWRIFSFSLTVTPVIIMVLEVVTAVMLLGGVGLWWSARGALDPELQQTLTDLMDQISRGGEDLDAFVQSLEPLLLQPAVIAWGLAVFAGVMPVIEEVIKPLALWALAGKRINEAEGFVGGLLTGAGFALLENVLFFSTATGVDEWLFLAIGRAGTGVLHMLASGLVGWGLAKMWLNGKWFQQALAIISAILLHGLWNALSLASGILPFATVQEEITLAQALLAYLPTIGLLIFSALAMLIINRRLRRQDADATPSPDVLTPSEEEWTQ